ncbi:hypothetical protein [Sulfitobacter sp. W074]|uniref:hypothetical protein n=1 Tax=Sulfitobacter sp. W074 TaxID=2867026 RepID=UPI0021A57E6F|nr:hypothetical protein [Sulfitobacter sp. W074]UWR38372.1 hypothetical protein K3762_04895 [Sulfitobacter sp. W074]
MQTGRAIDPSISEALCRDAEQAVVTMLSDISPAFPTLPEDLRTAAKTAATSIINLRRQRQTSVDLKIPGLTDQALKEMRHAMSGDHGLSLVDQDRVIFALLHIDELGKDPDVRRHLAPERIMVYALMSDICDLGC